MNRACAPQRFGTTPDLGTSPAPAVVLIVTVPDTKATVLASPVPTITLPPLPTGTMPADLLAAAQIVVTAMETNQPEMLRSLIGDEGVAAGGFAQGAKFKGYNNADEIVAAFDQALDQSTPVCKGFVPYIGALPDKAIVVYRGLDFDWSQFGLSGKNADGITFQLFKLAEGWRLVGITPFDFEWGLPILGPMQDCPGVQKTP